MNNRPHKIYIFYCSSGLEALEPVLQDSGRGSEIETVPLPCSGKIDIRYLTKAFETGADGVAIITCQEDECRYLEGNLRARKRAQAVDDLLEEVGLGKGRIAVIQLKDGGPEGIRRELSDFIAGIQALSGHQVPALVS